ncbi:tRNA (adenosine(37)-N6)-threonylcarbamoyltransferase complex ATPase subunit type 1 TsaE [Granulosicoccaceae sp. 1_MG-2023]|nr:tRNA (adenosine(37)-N6)-threonylcarbamoyltransferase complex ATPase subunit type 1 TsaE [Granulosicoccaceae sp. 1_MG-2023]
MQEFDVVLPDEAATLALGAALAAALQADAEGGVIFLNGDLGAGKTTLTRGLLHALGHSGAVKSPTYTLIESYEAGGLSLHHLDLYRLGSPDELDFLGLRELMVPGAVFLIEWPQQGGDWLPLPRLQIDLSYDGEGRRAHLYSNSATELLKRLKSTITTCD